MNLKDLLKKLSGRTSPSEGEGESVDSFELFEAESSFDSGLFLNSVEQLDEEDIELSPVAAQGKKKMKTSEIVRRVFLCVFAAVFLVSSILLIRSLISKYKAGRYRELEEYITYRQARELSIFSGNNEDMCINLDGEIVESSHLHLRVEPGRLRFVLPRGSEVLA